jgi:HlyD family secretion protein
VAARPGGSQFMVLSGNAPMKAVAPFQEMDAAAIVVGQKVSVALDALPDLDLTGKVTAIAPSATASSGAMSYYVTIALDATDPRLKEGMTVRATVHTAEAKNVLAVPNSAISSQNGQPMVLRENADGTESSVPIVTGIVGAELTEVSSGVAEGDRVVDSGVTK